MLHWSMCMCIYKCACPHVREGRAVHKPGFLKLKGCENVMVPMAISRSMLAPVRILLCVSLPQLVILVPQLSSPTRLSLSLSSAAVSPLPFPCCAHLSLPILAIDESMHPLCPILIPFALFALWNNPLLLACVVPPGAELWNLLKGDHILPK